MTFRATMLVLSLLSSGLIAGLFFGWSVSVIPGTSLVDDRAYIVTMQNINREIINPTFLASFVLTPLVLGVTAILYHRVGDSRRAWALGAAAVTYLFGVFAVTAARNVPLNDALDAFDLDRATAAEAAERRTSYETPWNQWHTLRTVASVATLALTSFASTLSDAE